MPLTEEQRKRIAEKEASLKESLRRDSLTDYFEGYFFVTLNVRDEAPILSTIEGNPEAKPGDKDAPHISLTDLGKGVDKCWNSIPNFYPNVTLLDYSIMPEHFHGLLYMQRVEKKHLGRVINGFMIGCTHEYWDTLGIPWREMKSDAQVGSTSQHTGTPKGSAIARPSQGGKNDPKWQDKDHTRSLRGPALFQRGYNDVEPITEKEVEIKKEYIRTQAERRLIKSAHHDRFHIFRNQHSNSWTIETIKEAISTDPFFSRNALKREEAIQKVLTRISLSPKDSTPSIDYLGNRQLLANPNKRPLICHRADATLFDQQKQATLDAARQGAVIVSAFISPRERDIHNLLMQEQLPFIEIMDNGFSQRYKPTGKTFYACGENRLVQLTPWTYQYSKQSLITREMCLTMNAFVRIISKEDDNWWKE